jgi:hypothetical protein
MGKPSQSDPNQRQRQRRRSGNGKSTSVLSDLEGRFARFRAEHPRGTRVPIDLRAAALAALREGVSAADLYRACGHRMESARGMEVRAQGRAEEEDAGCIGGGRARVLGRRCEAARSSCCTGRGGGGDRAEAGTVVGAYSTRRRAERMRCCP